MQNSRFWPRLQGESELGFSANRAILGQLRCILLLKSNTYVGIESHVRTKPESPDEIKQWLLKAVARLWPVAAGSISLRRSPCIRQHCSACDSGEGHPAYVLYGRRRAKRFSLYVPDELAGKVQKAIGNGRLLEEMIIEAGQRYTRALKRERERSLCCHNGN